MKKILIFMAVVIIILTIIIVKYFSYKNEYNLIVQQNAEYEQYLNKELNGLDIASIINKTVDKNTQNDIPKDENGIFVLNDTNSIEVDIYITDNETTYKMEKFYNVGIEQFVQYYRNIKFKCSKIEYHKSTGKIKYILFEQLETS